MRRLVATGTLGAAAIAFGASFWIAPYPVPSSAEVRAAWQGADAWLLARDGERLSRVRIDRERRRGEWTALADVSPALVAAVIAAEDRRFREHGGVDWAGVLGALRQSAKGERRGASTLTMQLAAQFAPALEQGGRRGPLEKWRQARQALALERVWSKDEILEAWLNLVPFRGELEGVDAASSALAGKRPSGLDRADAALLAALVRAPNASADLVARRACALDAEPAVCEEVKRRVLRGALVVARAKGRVQGDAPHLAAKLLAKPGEARRSTLDARLQRAAVESLDRHLRDLAGRNVEDGAVIAIDNATGEVLAYVGSSGALSRAAEVDGVAARRLAGSTLKPFLYGLAIERRLLTAASILDDSPLAVAKGGGLYAPQNYDRAFRGPVSLRVALASSLNVPAVRTLQLVGPVPFHERLRAFGFATLDRDAEHYGEGLALGGGEVTLADLANAYRALANGGCLSPLRFTADAPKAACTPAMEAGAAYVVGDILADPAARAGTFGFASALATPYGASVKTGTSKDMRDNWAVGYTSRFTVGVWVGNFSGEAMHDVSGVSGAAPVWREVMDAAMREAPREASAPMPAGVVRTVARFDAVEPDREELFLDGTQVERVVGVSRPAGRSTIDAPADGAIFAIDPDIPASRQRIVVRARGMEEGLKVRLPDGKVADANAPVLWTPVAGRHLVALVDARGRVVDRASFTVRP